MHSAICELEGRVHSASDFEKLPAADLARKRSRLLCCGCGQPAYYRKRSRDGHAACFGSDRHRPDCAERTPQGESPRVGSLRATSAGVRRVSNSGRTLVVTLSAPRSSARRVNLGSSAVASDATTTASRHVKEPEHTKETSDRYLGSLLRDLRNGSLSLSPADGTKIKLPNSLAGPAHERILVCSDIANAPAPAEERLYWGTVKDSEVLSNAIWISANGSRLTFYQREGTYEALPGADTEEKAHRLVGGEFLILGNAHSHDTWVGVDNPLHMAWRHSA